MSQKIFPTNKPEIEEISSAALFIYAEPITLTTTEQPLTNVVAANGVRTVNGEPTDQNIAFGRNGSNLIIREPGIYSIGVFVEFTNLPFRPGYPGVRLFAVNGGLTRRLWLYKARGAKPELAGDLESFYVVTAPTEFQLVAMVDGPNMALSRIYAEINVTRISGLAGAGPIL